MGCGGGRWPRVPWDVGGCGYPYPSPPPYPQGEWPERRAAENGELIRGELKKLYVRGEITRDQYLDAVERLNEGWFSLDDLWELRRKASAKERTSTEEEANGDAPSTSAGEAKATPGTGADSGADLAALKRKWEEVDKAQQGLAGAAKTAVQAADRLRKEMARLEELARITIPSDENKARGYLEQRQTLAEQVSELEARLASLKGDSERLSLLKTHLEAKMAAREMLAKEDVVSRLEKEVKELE